MARTPITEPLAPAAAIIHGDNLTEEAIAALCGGHDGGAYVLPEAFLRPLRRAIYAIRLLAAETTAWAEHIAGDGPREEAAIAEILEGAEGGRIVADFDAPLVLAADRRAALERRKTPARRARDLAVRLLLYDERGSWVPAIADMLAAALAETLAAAAPDVPLMVGADWRDPDWVHDAPEAVAAAFHRLLPLARRHDAIRSAAVGLWRLDPSRGPRTTNYGEASDGWTGIFAFVGLGAGIVHQPPSFINPLEGFVYAPAGHPVERLVAAVASEPAEAGEGTVA